MFDNAQTAQTTVGGKGACWPAAQPGFESRQLTGIEQVKRELEEVGKLASAGHAAQADGYHAHASALQLRVGRRCTARGLVSQLKAGGEQLPIHPIAHLLLAALVSSKPPLQERSTAAAPPSPPAPLAAPP